jgi:four helix bundle protein
MFNYERLDAYQYAIAFVRLALPLTRKPPAGFAPLAEQLRRAAASIPLNIAEGSGRFGDDGRRFYAIARGSALECASILDVMEPLEFATLEQLSEMRLQLRGVVRTLSGLLRTRRWSED